jgi:hypothetical protein
VIADPSDALLLHPNRHERVQLVGQPRACRQTKPRRQNADDRVRRPVDYHRAPDHCSVRAELFAPQPVGQHRDGGPVNLLIGRGQGPSERGGCLQDVEQRSARVNHRDLGGVTATREVCVQSDVLRQRIERLREAPPVFEVLLVDLQRSGELLPDLADGDQPVGFAIDQRFQ